MEVTISIIVPVFNAEKTIYKCIESIQNQTFIDWELLLIDDGSTDQTYKTCAEYAFNDLRIKVYHKKNGYYMSLINKYETDMVCQGMCKTGLGIPSKYCTGIEYNGDSKEGLVLLKEFLLLGFVWNKILKKTIIEENRLRFDENITFMEDEEFILKYFKYCRWVICTKNAGYNYMISYSCINQKYGNRDNFYLSLSNFQSIKYIFKSHYNHTYQSYLDMLTNSFFASYQFKANDIKKRLSLYREEVGRDVLKVNGLSFVSKLIFLLPLNVGNVLFRFKSKLSNIFL